MPKKKNKGKWAQNENGERRQNAKEAKVPKKKDRHGYRYWVKLQNAEVDDPRSRPPKSNRSTGKETGSCPSDNGETTKKDVQIILKIPSAVITQVISNIKAIENLAEKQKIPLRGTESFIQEVKDFDNSVVPGVLPKAVKCEGVKKYEETSLSAVDVTHPEPSTSIDSTSLTPSLHSMLFNTTATKRTFYYDREGTKRPKISTGEINTSGNQDLITVKTEPTEEIESPHERQPMNNIPSQENVKFTTVKTEPIEETCFQNRKFTEGNHSTAQNFNYIKIKQEPTDEIECAQDSHEVEVPLPRTEVKHPSVHSEGFIPVKTDTKEQKGPLQARLLSLRDKGYYKYGYKSIITESFDEKLDESLAKGVKISAQTQQTDVWNVIFHEEYKNMITTPQYLDLLAFRKNLPTYRRSAELLDVINNNQVVVISGETGCGKSTQVPQIILDDAICQGKGAHVHILVTQPRRIAASSLAMRVAQERAEELGNTVGYAVRLERHPSRKQGSIMYVTTGILLADLEVNQGLTDYSHIILDEVHERDCNVDFSMCMLKQVLKKRSDLKLILMSATLDSDRLSAYFDNCPIMHIEGLKYAVQPFFLEDVLKMTGFQLCGEYPWRKGNRSAKTRVSNKKRDQKYRAEIGPWLEHMKPKIPYHVYRTLTDYVIEDINIDLIMALLVHISKGPPGAILVFLTGIAIIHKLIIVMNRSGMFPESQYWIFPLHSRLNSLDQHKVFDRPPDHVRKIIVATNIAETSITIDDIEYVVDCGRVKLSGLDVEHNLKTLDCEFESKANLIQRRGRAGRCRPGVAFHLLTSYRAQTLPDRHLPELQRTNLLEPVLMIKKLRLGKAQAALKLVPDPPQEITVEKAVKHLRQCGALDDEERLTPLGWHLARLPVHPAAGKLLLFGALFGCVDRAASVAAVWGYKDPFSIIMGMEDKIDAAKRRLTLGEPSDHVALSEALIQWEHIPEQERFTFAYEHFLSIQTMNSLLEMKQQLCDTLRQMGFLAGSNVRVAWENRNADNLCVFKAIVAAALYPNIGIVRWSKNWVRNQQKVNVTTPEDGRVNLHQTSVMVVCPPQGPKPPASRRPAPRIPLCDKPGANWLVYSMKQKSSEIYLFEVTLVFTIPLLFFGELVVSKVEDSAEDCYMSVSTVKVRCRKETVDVLFKLRSFLDQVLASMVMESSDRSTRYSEFDELVFKAVIDLMTAEDERPEELDDSDSEPEPPRDTTVPTFDFIPL